MRRFAFFYLMKDDPPAVIAVAPRHAAYWRELQLEDYLGGPFDDRTGGLITFSLDDDANASDLVRWDPFVAENLLAASWLKEWAVTVPTQSAMTTPESATVIRAH